MIAETRVSVDPSAETELTLLNVAVENPLILYVTISPVLIPTANRVLSSNNTLVPTVKFVPEESKLNLDVNSRSNVKVLTPTFW